MNATPRPTPPRFDASLLGTLGSLEWRARYVMEGLLSGRHGSPFQGASVEFREYRDYQPGDDLRRLDWRLYARADRLCIRRYEQETNARCTLLLDTSASMAYRGGGGAWGTKLEAAQTLGLALGWLLLRQGDAVDLLAQRAGGNGTPRYLPPARAASRQGALLRELTALAPQGAEALPDLLAAAARIVHRRSLVLLLSDLLEPAETIEPMLSRLRFDGHEVLCLQILSGDEIDFPFTGSALFEDLETGDRRQVQGDAARAAYRERFGAFMARHEELFRRLEMPLVRVRTDEDPAAALARFLDVPRRRGR
jgi:uncharacterized protein (DUF58 family)